MGGFVCSLSCCFSVRREVGISVRLRVFTVAILAQGTNRGDALCAALFYDARVQIPQPVRVPRPIPISTFEALHAFAVGHTLSKTPDPI